GQFAYAEAVDHYERALQLLELGRSTDEHFQVQLMLGLGDTSWRAGEFEKAKEVFRKIAGIARQQKDAALLARAALGFGGPFASFNIFGLDEELIGLLREALALFPTEDSPVRARLIAGFAEAQHHTLDKAKLTTLAHEAIEMAR